MKNVFDKIILLLGAVALSFGVLFLFFGGTWQGVRFALELLGAVWIIQTSYSILIKEREEKKKEKELKEITDKYFKEN